MVEVCNSQHDPASVVADGIVLNPAELAAIMSPLKNACADLLPVLRISGFIFWFYWHIVDGAGIEPASPSGRGRIIQFSHSSKNRCGKEGLPGSIRGNRYLPLSRTDAPPLVHSLAITPWSVAMMTSHPVRGSGAHAAAILL